MIVLLISLKSITIIFNNLIEVCKFPDQDGNLFIYIIQLSRTVQNLGRMKVAKAMIVPRLHQVIAFPVHFYFKSHEEVPSARQV